MDKETVFLEDDLVKVTESRFVTQGKTYAMNNISSVSLYRIKRNKAFEIVLILVGTMLLFGDKSRVIGIAIAIVGMALLFLLKDRYSVRINSNSGESNGFTSKDKAYVNRIVDAVNEAIIHRG